MKRMTFLTMIAIAAIGWTSFTLNTNEDKKYLLRYDPELGRTGKIEMTLNMNTCR